MFELTLFQIGPERDNIGFYHQDQLLFTIKLYDSALYDAVLFIDEHIFTLKRKGYWRPRLIISTFGQPGELYKIKFPFFEEPMKFELNEADSYQLKFQGSSSKREGAVIDKAGNIIISFITDGWSFKFNWKARIYVQEDYPYLRFILGVIWVAIYSMQQHSSD